MPFPSNPTVGQVATNNGRSFQWDGYGWQLRVALNAPPFSILSGSPMDNPTLAAALRGAFDAAFGLYGGHAVGDYFDQSAQGNGANTTSTSGTNRIDATPFITGTPVTIDQAGVAVSTASTTAGAVGRIAIYSSGADGYPDALLAQTADFPIDATGYQSAPLAFSFQPGVKYFLAIQTSAQATMRSIAIGYARALGLTSSAAADYITRYSQSIAYASGLPAKWNFVSSHRVTNQANISIRMRFAA